jgi:alpha-1,6-mannosyltransferase
VSWAARRVPGLATSDGAARWRLGVVAVCAVAIEIAWLRLLGLGDLKQQVSGFAVLFFGAFAAYLLACWTLLGSPPRRAPTDAPAAHPPRLVRMMRGAWPLAIRRRAGVHPLPPGARVTKRQGMNPCPTTIGEAARPGDPVGSSLRDPALLLVLGGAVLFRLTSLAAAPTLSNDLNRYVWEGKALAAGWSPYHYPPDAPQLEPLRDAVWDGVNNRGVPSPYPPLAQGFGLLAHALAPESLGGPKLLAMLGDLAALGALGLLLRQAGRPLAHLVVYAWSPLVVLAFAHSGHNDAWMIALLLGAIGLAGAGRFTTSAAVLALATLAKALPLLAVPLFATVWGRRPWPLVVYVAVLALGYAPLILLGEGAPGSLFAYTLTWTGNESLFFLLRWGLTALGLPGLPLAKLLSLLAIAGGLLLLVVVPSLRARPLWWRVYVAFALTLAWASTVNPWYVTAVVPFLALALRPGRWPLVFRPVASWGWLLFSGTVALAYLTYSTGRWQGWSWVPFAEYGPLYALVGAAAVTLGARALYRGRVRLAGAAPTPSRAPAAPQSD